MLRKSCAGLLLVALAIGISSLPALADVHTFKVINAGGHQVDHVYISPISKNKWGPDQLESDQVIAPGHSVTWDVRTNCEMDVKVVYHDGNVDIEKDIDTCQYDLRLKY